MPEQKIKCPECGCNEVNVAVWGSSTTTDGVNWTNVGLNIDEKDESARCTNDDCDFEAPYSYFKND